MPNDRAFALFLTWTTYGTWLPGDERGYVSNTLQADGSYRRKQNRVGTEYDRDSALTRSQAQQLQRGETVWLTADQARIAASALIEASASRGWRIVRSAVMSNHVHVLICDCPDDAAAVLRILKGRTQAALSSAAGGARRWWTRSGSQRYLHDAEAVSSVSRYIEQQRGCLARVRDQILVDSSCP
jgi:REP element-mobilizing transposase RayT